jgi:hypothetical protein
MADDRPTIHVDNDWKKQIQEEKKRLAEEERQQSQAKKEESAPAQAAGTPGRRELPAASFETLVQSLSTQVLYHLGELGSQGGGAPRVNLDMAKHTIDTLAMLEEKTVHNLTADEKLMLDAALYEIRMRYVQVASQYT